MDRDDSHLYPNFRTRTDAIEPINELGEELGSDTNIYLRKY